MGGVLTSLVVEVAFTPGVWTDISADVDLSGGLTITHPAFIMGQTASSTTLDMSLTNVPDISGITKYTPDNAMGPYYPNVVRDKLVRITAVKGASSWVRFLGWIDRWEPDSGGGEPNYQRTQVTASGVLARYARRTLMSLYSECLLDYARTNSRAIDLWPLDDGDAPTAVRNVGFDATGDPTPAVAGKVVPATGTATGEISFGTADAGLLVEAVASFTRSDTTGNKSSPVLKLALQNAPTSRVSLWARVDSPPVGYDDAITGYDSHGTCLWRFGPVASTIVAGRTDMVFCQADGTVLTTMNVNDAYDGAWRWYSLLFYYSGAIPAVEIALRSKTVADSFIYGSTAFMGLDSDGRYCDGQDTRFITVGGLMSPRREGAQINTFMGSVGGIYVMHGTFGDLSYSDRSSPDTVTYGAHLMADYDNLSASVDSLVGGTVYSATTDFTPVAYTLSAQRTLLDQWSEMATTSGAVLGETPTGKRYYRSGADARPATVTFGFNVDTDVEGGPTWAHTEQPTRVTATSPNGSVTNINAPAEAGGLQADLDVATNAATSDYAAQVASYLTHRGDGLRLTEVVVDLTTSTADLWAQLMTMLPGDRGRLSGIPVGQYGYSYADCFLDGWTEVYTSDVVEFTIETQPADSPPKALTDDAEYGRVAVDDATVTGGTCIGTTATGTLVITSPTTPFSVQSADYPLDLDWQGERVTITSAPGSATSPQTMTVTARGVTPTGARVHSSGDTIDVWHSAAVAF